MSSSVTLRLREPVRSSYRKRNPRFSLPPFVLRPPAMHFGRTLRHQGIPTDLTDG